MSEFAVNQLITNGYDRVDVTYPTPTTEVYTFSFAGSVVGHITIIYTDSTKANIQSCAKTQ